jgi:hypothetical protein
MKVKFHDGRVQKIFLQWAGVISTILATLALFVDIPQDLKIPYLGAFLAFLALIYFAIWVRSNRLNHIEIKVEETKVNVKVGDIFAEPGLKAIAFNEYFDTIVDDNIIAKSSLNGVFLSSHLSIPIEDLDLRIRRFGFEADEVLEENSDRPAGKRQRYKLGTIFVHEEYLLVAMTKFDGGNRAVITMPEFLEFLIRFWDRVNKVYAQRSVTVPIFGSGITRISGHRNISDEDLLRIMLWTFRVSETRFKYPANLTIVIHKEKIGQINLLDLKLLNNGV